MKIIDDRGRIGAVTSETDAGVFARPEGIPYTIGDKDGVTGIANATLITATHWTRHLDGTLHGIWYDSPLHDFRTARILD